MGRGRIATRVVLPVTPDDEHVMTYAPGKLSEALASVNSSGSIRIAWVRATPSNVADVLRSYGTPRHFGALNVEDAMTRSPAAFREALNREALISGCTSSAYWTAAMHVGR